MAAYSVIGVSPAGHVVRATIEANCRSQASAAARESGLICVFVDDGVGGGAGASPPRAWSGSLLTVVVSADDGTGR